MNHPMPHIDGLWITKPDNQHTLMANPGAEASFYKDRKHNPDGIQEKPICTYNSCEKYPQTVCKECIGFVCEDHIWRHPDCEAGR